MTLQEYITTELGSMAQADLNFKERYEDKSKSIDDCLKYITQEAKKQAVNNCAAISDDDVLQWAIHYYQEKDVKPAGATPRAKVTTTPPKPKEEETKTAVLIPDPKSKKKTKAKKEIIIEDPRQLSLF